VLVRFPGLEVEYRFTDEVYAVGDTLESNGETWIVASVQDGSLAAGQQIITCQRPEAEASASKRNGNRASTRASGTIPFPASCRNPVEDAWPPWPFEPLRSEDVEVERHDGVSRP
jgi:hypothetical protein